MGSKRVRGLLTCYCREGICSGVCCTGRLYAVGRSAGRWIVSSRGVRNTAGDAAFLRDEGFNAEVSE
jgi:hypothetical protein